MIKIEAIVRPDRINIIVDALDAVGCRGFKHDIDYGAGVPNQAEGVLSTVICIFSNKRGRVLRIG